MKRVLNEPYSTAGRWLAGALVIVALVGTGYAVGLAKGRHAAREARDRACWQRDQQAAAQRGYTVIRLAAFPCMEAR